MAQAKSSFVLVIEHQKLLGIFTERDVARIAANTALTQIKTLSEVMTRDVISIKISEVEEIFALSRLLTKHRIRHLPVLDEQGCVIGIVTPESIRSLLKPEYLLRYVRVADVMTRQVVCGSPELTVLAVAQKMTRLRVSCVVMTEERTNFPIGIITERDIVKLHQSGLNFSQAVARDTMSSPLSMMHPQNSLWDVHQKMQQLNVRRLVITNESGELAGIVTQTQMLNMLDPVEMHHVMAQMKETISRQTNELDQLNQKLQTTNRELARLAIMDELTQIMNRRQFNKFLASERERLTQLDKPLSLIMCDVDHFKSYNDTYGHLAGDQCLVEIAKVLKEATRRASDLVARFGGEEFVLILPNTSIDVVERISKDILSRVKNLKIPHTTSNPCGVVTISLGAVTTFPGKNGSPEILLQVADQLLYQSKQKGRNTYSAKALQ